jgi:hypothetical protein
MREQDSRNLDVIECAHGVPLDTDCPKCQAIGGKEYHVMGVVQSRLEARIVELEEALREVVRIDCDYGRCAEVARAALRSDTP